MVPIYETDLNRERHRPSEWDNYELWEKVEAREKKKQRLWVLFTLLVSVFLLSIPLWKESQPRWHALKVANQMAQLLSQMRLRATIERVPYILKFDPSGELNFSIIESNNCLGFSEAKATFEYSNSLRQPPNLEIRRLTALEGDRLGVPGLISEVCYDPTRGFILENDQLKVAGLAVGSANDLALGRSDRLAVVLIRSGSAEISFH